MLSRVPTCQGSRVSPQWIMPQHSAPHSHSALPAPPAPPAPPLTPRCPNTTPPFPPLPHRYLVIFQNYAHDLEAVQKLYEKHKYEPPVPRNAPPVTGNIMWARQLLRRIETPMLKFAQVGLALVCAWILLLLVHAEASGVVVVVPWGVWGSAGSCVCA